MRDIDYIGRYGGEEFIAILPDTDLQNGLRVAERLRKSVDNADVIIRSGETIPITMSLGIAELNDPENSTIDSLIVQADAAMYQAKNSGRNCVKSADDLINDLDEKDS